MPTYFGIGKVLYQTVQKRPFFHLETKDPSSGKTILPHDVEGPGKS